MMQEVSKAGFNVAGGTVEDELQRVITKSGKGLEDFRTALKENGIEFEYFKRKLETQILINGYLEERIFSGAPNDVEKARLYQSWFNNAKILREIVYYDKNLERIIQEQISRKGYGG